MSEAIPTDLAAGYRRFRASRYSVEEGRYRKLAQGQAPATMVVACADSRVDPATIFDAGPGELFVVRNVANLVPPADPSAGYHGTSAALEFAVNGLGVRQIVVMGHGLCGGIAAALAAGDRQPVGDYIAPWVALAAAARVEVLSANPEAGPEELQHALEHEAIAQSLANLMTFGFVRRAVQSGGLSLHGAWFSIEVGELHWRDPRTGLFSAVPPGD